MQDPSPTLFDIIDQPSQSAKPQCRMCARPAKWVHTQQRWAIYCAGDRSCSNRERICQNCQAPFYMNVDGAGTKYCSTACKHSGYVIGYKSASRLVVRCAWCGGAAEGRPHSVRALWPYICPSCTDPIKHIVPRLRHHRVPHERARQLLDDPCCEICGRDIVAKVRNTTTGIVRADLVVDHDHNCCPGTASCGKCIRGLICGNCNTAAGHLKDDPVIARSLAAYLERVTRPDPRVV